MKVPTGTTSVRQPLGLPRAILIAEACVLVSLLVVPSSLVDFHAARSLPASLAVGRSSYALSTRSSRLDGTLPILGMGGWSMGAHMDDGSPPQAKAIGNSSPVRENGTLVGHLDLPVNSTGLWGIFDTELGELLMSNGTAVQAWFGIPPNGSYLATPSMCADEIALDPLAGLLYVGCPGGLQGTDTVNVVNVSGSQFNVTSISSSAYLWYPYELVYDSADGLVYVLTLNHAFLTVIQGTKLLGIVSLPGEALSESYDSIDGDVYANYDSNTAPHWKVAVINGTSLIGNITLPLNGTYPPGAPTSLLDPSMRLLYFGTELNGTVGSVVAVNASETNGTDFVGTLPGVPSYLGDGEYYEAGYNPISRALYLPSPNGNQSTVVVISGDRVAERIPDAEAGGLGMYAYDYPPTGAEFVSDGPGIAVISTFLSESQINITPNGTPADSLDVGRSSTLTTFLSGTGTGNDTVTISTSPRGWLTCTTSQTIAETLSQATVRANCVPSHEGNVTIWVNVSDGVGTVSSWISVQSFAEPTPHTPVAYVGNSGGATAADVGQAVSFVATLPVNSSPTEYYTWLGVPGTAVCTGQNSSTLNCTFYVVENFTVSVRATDGNGASATSPSVYFEIYPRLLVFAPTVSRSSADVGQTILFTFSVEGGTGDYPSMGLEGLRGGTCVTVSNLELSCSFPDSGTYTAIAVVNDTNLNSVTSSPTSVTIFSLPRLNPTNASRVDLDVGQSVTFWSNVTGGAGGDLFIWNGLPGSCTGTTTNAPTCKPSAPGAYDVSATVTDRNGATSPESSGLDLIVYGALVIESVRASPSNAVIGSKLWINASVTGGSPYETFGWTGLPTGCSGNTSQIVCVPTAAGTYSVVVAVEDGNGAIAKSTTIQLEVSTGGASTSVLQSPPAEWTLVGATLLIVAVATLFLLRRRGRKGLQASTESGDSV
jgi:hypothetical protein